MTSLTCQTEKELSFQKSLTRDTESVILSMRPAIRGSLGALIFYCLRFNDTKMSQSQIGRLIGKSRQHVNYATSELMAMGALTKKRRPHPTNPLWDDSCEYILNPIFLGCRDIIYKLKDYFPVFSKFFLFAALQYSLKYNVSSRVTPLSIKEIKRNISYSKSSHTKVMRDAMIDPISIIIRRLPLKLTTHEQIRLSAFSDEAITYALDVYLPRKDRIGKPVEYLIRLCRNFHLERDLPVNDNYSQELADTLNGKELPENKEPPMEKHLTSNNEQVPEALSEFRNIHKHQQSIKQYDTVQDDLVTRSQGEDLEEVKRKLLDNQAYVNSCKILGIEPTKIPNAICLKS